MNTANDNREHFFMHIWEGRYTVVGNEIDHAEFHSKWLHDQKPTKWAFVGKWATIHVITTDSEISRHNALNFVTAWMQGKVVHYAVDLDRCTVEIRRGIEITPRH